jgi:outer membrane protein assembly factor BamD
VYDGDTRYNHRLPDPGRPRTTEFPMTQRLVCLLLVLVLAATAGCASSREDRGRDPAENARRLYEDANASMRGGNYAAAIGAFENLTAIYPFSEEARQARLDLMFAYWRNEQPDSAIAAADRFILENPTHPRVDYALYMKGLARFPPDAGALERLFRHDKHLRPSVEMQNAFNTFAQLLQQHPDSEYAEDARQRMVYLRNRMAMHEVRVAEFYLDRHAHVAAINRARRVVETFDETPAVLPALQIMLQGYENLGLDDLAAETRRVIALNDPGRRARR